MFQSNCTSLGGSAGDFAGTSSFSSVTEAVIPECSMGTAGGKQWAQSCRSGLLRRRGMNDGDLGTNRVDASTPGMSTSLAADTNSC